MFIKLFAAALGIAILLAPGVQAQAADPSLTLPRALSRALSVNPRLSASERDIGIATGRRIQAGALPNPDVSFELDDALGSGPYKGTRSAETTLALGQLVELFGKRSARIAVGAAGVDVATFQRAALRLEILSDTASAFFNVLGAQRRVQALNVQIAALDRLTPLLQRRVDAGAASPAEVARAQVAADLVKADRERALASLAIYRRELASLMGVNNPDFGPVVGDFATVTTPPAFASVIGALETNPQLVRWTAVRAQRDAELLAARLKPLPDVRVTGGWRHYRDTGDNAVRVGISVPIPLFDRNTGGIIEAQENRAKADAESLAARAALTLTLGRAYETLVGANKEIRILRSSAIPTIRRAVEAIESGYSQGRFSLLEVLDAQNAATQAALREVDALISYHTSVAILEGLTGVPLGLRQGETVR